MKKPFRVILIAGFAIAVIGTAIVLSTPNTAPALPLAQESPEAPEEPTPLAQEKGDILCLTLPVKEEDQSSQDLLEPEDLPLEVEIPEQGQVKEEETPVKPALDAAPVKLAPDVKPAPSNPVVTTRTETQTAILRFQTLRQNDSTLDKGKTAVSQRGVNGEETITFRVTLTDGRETARVETGRRVTKTPVNEIIRVGTKEAAPAPKPIVSTKEETVTETIPFTTEERPSASMAKGETRIQEEGRNGLRTIIYTITYTDGKETGRVVKSSATTTQPVTQVILVGTRVEHPFHQYTKDILPAGFKLGPAASPGGAGLYKGDLEVGSLSVGVITLFTERISHAEQRELVRFFGRFRNNIGRGNDTEKLLHLFDAYRDSTVVGKPSYEGITYVAGVGYRGNYIQIGYIY